ncbi:hypothetical protein GCM10009662_42520 [Catellatospora coxensis]|uniref:Lipoprotein n=1 Tax=Catellatospora coxensis TaxID=310354 RepID=A0A8J3KTC8_9ACTN|nr:hypothetical protein Cco03nite_26020 [Catellatospora coxensis]
MLIAGALTGALLTMACSVRWNTGDEGVAPSPAPVVSADAATTASVVDLLRKGTKFIDETSFRTDVDISGGQVTTRSHRDNPRKRGDALISFAGKDTEIRMVDEAVYMKSEQLKGVGDGWLSLDPAKVPASFELTFAAGKNDPGGSARLLNAIVTAEIDKTVTSGTEINGTMDLSKVGSGNGISFRLTRGQDFPEAMKHHPFSASLDAQGRLIRFMIPASGGAPSASLRYSDFGAPVAVSPPTGATRAPDALYAQLGLQ